MPKLTVRVQSIKASTKFAVSGIQVVPAEPLFFELNLPDGCIEENDYSQRVISSEGVGIVIDSLLGTVTTEKVLTQF